MQTMLSFVNGVIKKKKKLLFSMLSKDQALPIKK